MGCSNTLRAALVRPCADPAVAGRAIATRRPLGRLLRRRPERQPRQHRHLLGKRADLALQVRDPGPQHDLVCRQALRLGTPELRLGTLELHAARITECSRDLLLGDGRGCSVSPASAICPASRTLMHSCLVEAGKEPKQDHQPSVLHDPSLIIANWDRPLIELWVVLLVWISGGVFQQLLDAPVGQPPRGLGRLAYCLSASVTDFSV
jgi:hypothetical protein